MSTTRTPAQWFALVLGVVLLLMGVFGFFVDSSFATGESIAGSTLVFFTVNAWANLLYILSGIALLASSTLHENARFASLAFGILYLVGAIWSFIIGTTSPVLNVLPMNTATTVLYMVIGILGIGAALAAEEAVQRGPTATT